MGARDSWESRVAHGAGCALDSLPGCTHKVDAQLPSHGYSVVCLQKTSRPESRRIRNNSLLQPMNLLTTHEICCQFSVILGNSLKTDSLFS